MRVADPGAVLIARQLYEGLTRWDPVRRRVRPAAARSWRVSRGGRRFTFRLRRGLSFHDGTPVTARSFRAAFDRIASKENASDLAYTLEPVKGFYAVNGTGRRGHLAGVRTPDPSTIVFTLTRPLYGFPAVLTHPGLVPVPPKALRRPGRFTTRPVGNGPFALQGVWRGSGPVVLQAFGDSAVKPRIDRIEFIPFQDAALSWFPFTQGRLDVAEVPAGEVASARRRYGDRGFVPLAAGLYFGLRVKSRALSDRALRVAISSAIDRRAIARDIFEGALRPPRGIVPTGIEGFRGGRCRRCTYAPSRARRLVESLPRRKRVVTIDYNDNDVQRQVARAVRHHLEAAGLTVRLRAWPIERYLRRVADGEVAMYRFGWIAEYPSPDVFLSTLFASDSPDNHSGFASKDVDRLLKRARSEPRERRRLRLYRRAERLILQGVPVVPIGSFEMRWAIQRRVRGIHIDSFGGFDAAGVTVRSA
jgi:oligopeptide transport system substrate-binding protein